MTSSVGFSASLVSHAPLWEDFAGHFSLFRRELPQGFVALAADFPGGGPRVFVCRTAPGFLDEAGVRNRMNRSGLDWAVFERGVMLPAWSARAWRRSACWASRCRGF